MFAPYPGDSGERVTGFSLVPTRIVDMFSLRRRTPTGFATHHADRLPTVPSKPDDPSRSPARSKLFRFRIGSCNRSDKNQPTPHDIIRLPVEYFVRTMEKHKESRNVFSSEIATYGLTQATHAAKQMVLESDPSIMLQADACCRNRGAVRSGVRTKYRCWINRRGEFHESVMI